MIGWEASVIWQWWAGAFLDPVSLEEPESIYLQQYPKVREAIGEMDARSLLELLEFLRGRLEEMGLPSSAPAEPPYVHALPERLLITSTCRILLPDRYNVEIRMPPLVKTLFLFYLRHPEGVRFRDLHLHRKELISLYGAVSGCGERDKQERSIDRLIDPFDNSVNEKASRIGRSLSRYLPTEILETYLLHGSAGAAKRIPLDRTLVEWESPLLFH